MDATVIDIRSARRPVEKDDSKIRHEVRVRDRHIKHPSMYPVPDICIGLKGIIIATGEDKVTGQTEYKIYFEIPRDFITKSYFEWQLEFL